MESWIDILHSRQGAPTCLVTVIGFDGSIPGTLGAKMLVDASGLLAGTIGGGKIEAYGLRSAQELLAGKENLAVKKVNLQTDIGMSCGGVVHLLFEVLGKPAWQVHVFGAGHVAQALVPLLCSLQAQVVAYDPRPEWLERFAPHPNLRLAETYDPAEMVPQIPPEALVVIMTQGHATDLPILAACLKCDFPYLGVIGSRTKRMRLVRELRKLGIESETFHCPIGLEGVGGNAPAEIAVSVSAQLLKSKSRCQQASSNQQ